jgi:hypothetical protein
VNFVVVVGGYGAIRSTPYRYLAVQQQRWLDDYSVLDRQDRDEKWYPNGRFVATDVPVADAQLIAQALNAREEVAQ